MDDFRDPKDEKICIFLIDNTKRMLDSYINDMFGKIGVSEKVAKKVTVNIDANVMCIDFGPFSHISVLHDVVIDLIKRYLLVILSSNVLIEVVFITSFNEEEKDFWRSAIYVQEGVLHRWVPIIDVCLCEKNSKVILELKPMRSIFDNE